MDSLLDGTREAFRLLAAGDRELFATLWLSLWVAGAATAIAMAIGVPAGVFLALRRFRGRGLLVTFVNAGMGLPPVVVGLVVFLLLARSGPLGGLGLLYTPTAMVLAQIVIATPIAVGVTLAAVQGLDPRLPVQLRSLGATRLQLGLGLVREARASLLAALAAAFGSVISEVGAVMLVGGNLRGETRVMTTAIVMETRQGDFARAIALALVLLAIAVVINALFTWLQQRRIG
jgi:tungstate transport system permease protein